MGGPRELEGERGGGACEEVYDDDDDCDDDEAVWEARLTRLARDRSAVLTIEGVLWLSGGWGLVP